MKKIGKYFLIFVFFCSVISMTACSKETESEPEETTAEMFQHTTTSPVTTSTSSETSTSTSESTTSTSEMTSTIPETTTSTEITTTEMMTTVTETTVTTVTETVPQPLQMFEPGIWWAKSSTGDRYFYFEDTGTAGSVCDQENGFCTDFVYTINENSTLTFQLDGTVSGVSVVFPDSRTAVLTWDSGSTETLTYQGLGNLTTFHFYPNLELCAMALNYYEAHHDLQPSDAVAQVQENGMILIQLYGVGEENNWYMVDRFTAKGIDSLGNAVDLTES